MNFPLHLSTDGLMLLKNPIISCCPDTPCHMDNNFHDERADAVENLWHISCHSHSDTDRGPTSFGKVVGKEEVCTCF
jgi:hypothetical protein